jgi:hypothetical protein
MYRLLIVLVIALLAACTTPSTQTDRANGSDAGASVPQSAGASTGSGSATPACADAFAPIAELDVDSLSDLGDLEEVQATIESCESVADWTAGAQAALGIEANPATVELLLGIECNDPGAGNTPVCEDLAAS